MNKLKISYFHVAAVQQTPKQVLCRELTSAGAPANTDTSREQRLDP